MSLLSTSFHAITFRCQVFFVENQTCDTKSVHLIFSLSQGSIQLLKIFTVTLLLATNFACYAACCQIPLLVRMQYHPVTAFIFYVWWGSLVWINCIDWYRHSARYACELARAVSASGTAAIVGLYRDLPLNLFSTLISILQGQVSVVLVPLTTAC